MNLNSPFFILSNPRSGSSLLRIMLDCHAKLTVPPECGFIEWWYKKYNNWNSKDSESYDKINEFCKDLISSRKFETWHFDVENFKQQVYAFKPINYSELCGLVYFSFAKQKGKDIQFLGDKNNYYINKLDTLLKVYPQAKFIHLIRDGRDVATSYLDLKNVKTTSKYKPQLPTDIDEIANEWVNNVKRISDFFGNIPHQNKIVVKYENLITDTEGTTKNICEFLGVVFDSNMLKYYAKNSEEAIEPIELLDWKMKTLEKPEESNIGKFKNLLSKNQIKSFETKAKDTLKSYGYF